MKVFALRLPDSCPPSIEVVGDALPDVVAEYGALSSADDSPGSLGRLRGGVPRLKGCIKGKTSDLALLRLVLDLLVPALGSETSGYAENRGSVGVALGMAMGSGRFLSVEAEGMVDESGKRGVVSVEVEVDVDGKYDPG